MVLDHLNKAYKLRGAMVDQIGTVNQMISDKIRIDAKALRLLSWLMSAVVVCDSLRIADRFITRCSLAQVQVAPLFFNRV